MSVNPPPPAGGVVVVVVGPGVVVVVVAIVVEVEVDDVDDVDDDELDELEDEDVLEELVVVVSGATVPSNVTSITVSEKRLVSHKLVWFTS
jgi:hypothetical protein